MRFSRNVIEIAKLSVFSGQKRDIARHQARGRWFLSAVRDMDSQALALGIYNARIRRLGFGISDEQ